MYALCNRRPFPAGYAAPALPSLSPALDFLLDLAFRLPPLLAAADLAIMSNMREASTYAGVIRDLNCLGKTLKSWLKSFGQCTDLECEHPGDSTWEQAVSSLNWTQANSVYDLTCEAFCRTCLLLIHQGRPCR
jgi:hypothetical protein